MYKQLKIYLIVVAIAVINCSFTIPHKFYSSITQLTYNAKSKSAEVVITVFADDWEQALTKFHGRKVKIEDTAIDALSLPYLQKYFEVKTANRVDTYQLIGLKLEQDIAEIYIEIPLGNQLKNTTIAQNILLDMFEAQINIVNCNFGTTKKTLLFKKGAEQSQKLL